MIRFENATIYLDAEGKRPLRVNASFNREDFILVVGPNGSGKTSFLDLIAGARQLAGGRMSGIPQDSSIAYAVQDADSGLLPWRSIISNILLPSRLSHPGQLLTSKAARLLAEFRLLERARDFPYRLSGGEKQAINFIRTICTPAHIRLFDEVTASLHSSFKSIARRFLPATNAVTTTFFVSHDVGDLVLPFTRFMAIQDAEILEVSRHAAEDMMTDV
jgi:ABC-type nitrate/sulfonate/bicarbonate transport system ATPase subunit